MACVTILVLFNLLMLSARLEWVLRLIFTCVGLQGRVGVLSWLLSDMEVSIDRGLVGEIVSVVSVAITFRCGDFHLYLIHTYDA